MKLYILQLKYLKKIVQYSPQRTGSTLVFNVLKEIFENHSIKKTHKYKKKYFLSPTVVTYRNPIDAIASLYRVKNLQPSIENIYKIIAEFDTSGPNELIKLSKKKNILLLQYELFLHNFDYIFDKVESFFQITIPKNKKTSIQKKLNIKEVQKTTNKLGEFNNFDENTKWHGNHVSNNNGEKYANDFFNTECLEILQKHYHNFLVFFRYIEI